MSGKLAGKTVAFLATDGVEQVELTSPWQALEKEGAKLELISLEAGSIDGYNHLDKADSFKVDVTIDEAKVDSYDALVLPGGVANPDALRTSDKAVTFIKGFFMASKPVAAICHAPWTLVEADAVRGRKLTSFPSVQTDVKNAGGHWVDEEVVNDNGLITSRNPDDLPAFNSTIIEVLASR